MVFLAQQKKEEIKKVPGGTANFFIAKKVPGVEVFGIKTPFGASNKFCESVSYATATQGAKGTKNAVVRFPCIEYDSVSSD